VQPIPAIIVMRAFQPHEQGRAMAVFGLGAVLTPALGPTLGGVLVDLFGWRSIFFMVVPFCLASLWMSSRFVPSTSPGGASPGGSPTRPLDWLSLLLAAAATLGLLNGLVRLHDGFDMASAMLLADAVALMAWFVLRQRRLGAAMAGGAPVAPLMDLTVFADRRFAMGTCVAFIYGMALFGSTYLMPFFLGLVREHDSLRIGEIMLVTGIAQLIAAPIAVYLEQRVGARTLTVFGFVLFAAGLLMSTRQTADTDFAEMLLPQVLRGVATMFCLLPPTRMALGRLSPELVADGSGLFNLMRNLGGAIGLALIDTTIFSRAATYGTKIVEELQADNIETAVRIGIPRDAFIEQIGIPPDEFTEEMIRPLVERQALVEAINDAWLLIGVLTALAVILVFFVRRIPPQNAVEGSGDDLSAR
jgi:DHA2 family multidrug resistance protein